MRVVCSVIVYAPFKNNGIFSPYCAPIKKTHYVEDFFPYCAPINLVSYQKRKRHIKREILTY
nr:MAG TPA_asm: hypothetical protein [Bacteriophage sp.]